MIALDCANENVFMYNVYLPYVLNRNFIHVCIYTK